MEELREYDEGGGAATDAAADLAAGDALMVRFLIRWQSVGESDGATRLLRR